MDTPEKPKRWRRRIAGAVLLLCPLIAYPLGMGPAQYLMWSGQLAPDTYARMVEPVDRLAYGLGIGDAFSAYRRWWEHLYGERHGLP